MNAKLYVISIYDISEVVNEHTRDNRKFKIIGDARSSKTINYHLCHMVNWLY